MELGLDERSQQVDSPSHSDASIKPIAEEKSFFNDVGKRYEDAYAQDPSLQAMLCRFLELLQQQRTSSDEEASTSYDPSEFDSSRRILDCGCGTGRPVAQALVAAGHEIWGIDFSSTMINLARDNFNTIFSQLSSGQRVGRVRFEVQDMLTFSPSSLPIAGQVTISPAISSTSDSSKAVATSPGNSSQISYSLPSAFPAQALPSSDKAVFGAIVAMFSFFTLSPQQILSMIHKFSWWLCPGGYVLIGTIAAEDFQRTLPHMYELGRSPSDGARWATGIPELFMGQTWSINLLTRQGWREALEQEDLELVEGEGGQMDKRDFVPPSDLGCEQVEPHLFLIAMKKG